jgi:hypothetical protein
MFSNIICIHLRRFKSVEEFQTLLDDNNLDQIDPESLFNLMLDGYTKLFLDVNTFKIVGLTHQENKRLIQISEDFILFMKNMNSITIKSSKILTIDAILDKITSKGIESLTKREKEFLNNNSQNL